jgi:hypothetical protein
MALTLRPTVGCVLEQPNDRLSHLIQRIAVIALPFLGRKLYDLGYV